MTHAIPTEEARRILGGAGCLLEDNEVDSIIETLESLASIFLDARESEEPGSAAHDTQMTNPTTNRAKAEQKGGIQCSTP